jgi:hypothetical protein
MRRLVQQIFSISLILILLSTSPWIFCQSDPIKPVKVYRITYEIYPNDWYVKQASLWKKEMDKNPKDAEAWVNYYNAVRYARFTETIETEEKQQKLKMILAEMEKEIPDSYEYLMVKERTECNIHDISLSEKLYQMNPARPAPYYTIISHAEVYGKKQMMKEFCEKLYQSRDIETWLINYNYNVLMSLEKDAIIFTNGDNDTYPCWMLQQALGIRQDVLLLNISLAPTNFYLERVMKERGIDIDVKSLLKKAFTGSEGSKRFSKGIFVQELCIAISKAKPEFSLYFALTVWESFYKPLKENLYVVGLAFRYSPERIDNLAFIKKNIEEKFRFDYLDHEWYDEDIIGKNGMAKLNLNYITPMIMLAEHYKISGELQKATNIKEKVLSIAKQGGEEKEISKYLVEKGLF